MRNLFLIILLLFAFIACNNSKSKQASHLSDTDITDQVLMHKILVVEVIQTSNYTYLYVSENNQSYWVAISKQDVAIGDELLYLDSAANEMVNFYSKELNRNFSSILFISRLTNEPESMSMSSIPHDGMQNKAHSGRKVEPAQVAEPVGKANGGITIAELFSNKSEYSGKKVKIRGTVVKVNNQIMGRNWVHLQDGTKNGEEYDLTFTTQEKVTLNDVVTFEGVVALDKDFTSGYFYPVIVEEATLLN